MGWRLERHQGLPAFFKINGDSLRCQREQVFALFINVAHFLNTFPNIPLIAPCRSAG